MKFSFDDRQNALHEKFRRLGEEIGTGVADREATSELDLAGWKRCAENGVQGLLLPSEHGGGGEDSTTYVRAMEGLGYGCRDNGLLMAIGAQILAVSVPLSEYGTDAQRAAYLSRMASGEWIGSNAMSEPESGSDALALRTRATPYNGGYRLTGRKLYATNAPIADLFLVYATLDPALGFTGVTAFLVRRSDAGVTVAPAEEKMGLRTAPWGRVDLDECWVSVDRRLGAEKQGSAIFARSMMVERALLLAPWLGVMEREIEACVAHCRRRRQFGKHLGHFQSVSNRLVDMWTQWEVSRMLIYRAADDLAAGRPGVFPEIGKLYTSESAVEVLTSALHLHGALGYTRGAGIERHLRDALGMTISSGVSDLQRVVAAGKLGLHWPAP